MSTTNIPSLQLCLFVGQGACGLDGVSSCSFCESKKVPETTSSGSSSQLLSQEVFDDTALPWGSENQTP